MGLHRVGHDWVTNTLTHTHTETWVNYQFCHLSPLGKYCYLTKPQFPHLENRYNNITIVFLIKIKCTWYFRTVGSTQHMWNKWWQLVLCSALIYSSTFKSAKSFCNCFCSFKKDIIWHLQMKDCKIQFNGDYIILWNPKYLITNSSLSDCKQLLNHNAIPSPQCLLYLPQ